MKKAGEPISYQAPKEGAIGWVDGFSHRQGRQEHRSGLRVARNISTPPRPRPRRRRIPATIPRAIGADKLLSDKARTIFNEAYPGKSIDNMWWRPVEPTWFADLRGQYAEKFKAA